MIDVLSRSPDIFLREGEFSSNCILLNFKRVLMSYFVCSPVKQPFVGKQGVLCCLSVLEFGNEMDLPFYVGIWWIGNT